MKYMGSKRRIAKHIVPIMLKEAEALGIKKWVEPFVGGGNLIDKIPHEYHRVGYDLCGHAIMAMIDIRDRPNELPESFTEYDYKFWRSQNPSMLNSWACIVTSFGAKINRGYAREKGSDETTFCGQGKRNAIKQSPQIQGVEFINSCYKNVVVENAIIYCDPPYQGTQSYRSGKINHDEFFQWCRDMKKIGNVVFVSEYSAPEDFIVVWEGEVDVSLNHTGTQKKRIATEKLFRV